MSHSNLELIEDKEGNHGHKATFLTSNTKITFSADDLLAAKEKLNLHPEDTAILDSIIQSLKEHKKLPFTWTPQEEHFVRGREASDIAKYLVYRYKFKLYPKQRKVAHAPLHIVVEPTSICNLRCVMCFQLDETFTTKEFMGRMSLDMFKQVIDEASDLGVYALSVGTRGEPFLNKHTVEMLEYASNKKTFFDIKLVTNGTLMTEAHMHGVFKTNVNIIQFSIDAHYKELYEKIRVGGKFEKVLANVKKAVEIRNTHYPNSKTEIRVSGVKLSDEQDPVAFNEFWSKIVDVVVLVKPQERTNTYGNDILNLNTPCDFLWERINVWYDGVTNPCDEDYKSLLTPGKFPAMTLKQIWHGQGMNRMRELHLNKQRSCLNPCDKCGV